MTSFMFGVGLSLFALGVLNWTTAPDAWSRGLCAAVMGASGQLVAIAVDRWVKR